MLSYTDRIVNITALIFITFLILYGYMDSSTMITLSIDLIGPFIGAYFGGKYAMKAVKEAHKLSEEKQLKENQEKLDFRFEYFIESLKSIAPLLYRIKKNCKENKVLINSGQDKVTFNNESLIGMTDNLFDLIEKDDLLRYFKLKKLPISSIYRLNTLLKEIVTDNPRKLIYEYMDRLGSETDYFDSYRMSNKDATKDSLDKKYDEYLKVRSGIKSITLDRLEYCKSNCLEAIHLVEKFIGYLESK